METTKTERSDDEVKILALEIKASRCGCGRVPTVYKGWVVCVPCAKALWEIGAGR